VTVPRRDFLLQPIVTVGFVDTDQRNRIAALMARMASGDAGAAISLYLEFGSHVRAKVAKVARSQGARHLTADDLDGLAVDVCLDLLHRAGSWDPDGGALPWVWAQRRIVTRVASYVGRYGATYDDTVGRSDAVEDLAFAGDDAGEDEALDRLAARSPECALLRDALAALVSVRDGRVFLQFTVQQDGGDPSPSVTVGAAFGLSPANVRQIVRRVRQRLSSLAASDPRYAALAGLALLRVPGRAAA
jgi:hypothetical protein